MVGFLLVAQFAGLGIWQVLRGLEKRETQELYRDGGGFNVWQPGSEVRAFQRVQISGRFDAGRQIVLDNIILNSRYGHYILAPLDLGAERPLLLVNRGWVEKTAYEQPEFSEQQLGLPEGQVTVRGRVGALPKAGFKMGDAFAPSAVWPKHAVYPSVEEVEAELGRPVQPFVLLMYRDDAHGFVRTWAPTEFGPGKHFGYAFQWFAMGVVLSGLLAWNYRKKKFDS